MRGRDFIAGCNIFLTIFGLMFIMIFVFVIGYGKGVKDEYNYMMQEQQCEAYGTEGISDFKNVTYRPSARVYRR